MSTKPAIKHILQQLTVDKQQLDKCLYEKTLLAKEAINLNIDSLSDIFLLKSFDSKSIKPYFENDAWDLVMSIVDKKKIISTCTVCNKFCLKTSIQCSRCLFWFHYECVELNKSKVDKVLSTIWLCSKCRV